MLEPNPSLFCVLAKGVEGIALEGALYAREFWQPGLYLGRLGKGSATVRIEAVGRISDALKDGHILGEGEVDRCYAGRLRLWVKVGDFPYIRGR